MCCTGYVTTLFEQLDPDQFLTFPLAILQFWIGPDFEDTLAACGALPVWWAPFLRFANAVGGNDPGRLRDRVGETKERPNFRNFSSPQTRRAPAARRKSQQSSGSPARKLGQEQVSRAAQDRSGQVKVSKSLRGSPPPATPHNHANIALRSSVALLCLAQPRHQSLSRVCSLKRPHLSVAKALTTSYSFTQEPAALATAEAHAPRTRNLALMVRGAW